MTRQLRKYQREGAAFGASRRHALLADLPGLGKTCQAVRWLDLEDARRAIVLTTASHVYGFAQEVRDWQQTPRSVAVDDPDADVCVTTAARVARDWGFYTSRRYECLVIDECHHLKEPEAQRTRAVYGDDLDRGQGLVGAVEARGGKVLLLSGTPTPNYQTELYTHYRRLWPDMIRMPLAGRYMEHEDFIQRFSTATRNPKSGRLQPRANRNVARLRAMNEQVALRRTWEDVGIEMPAVQVRKTPLFSDLQSALQSRPDLAAELKASLDEISQYAFAGREQELQDPSRAAALLADLATDMRLHMATAHRLLGEIKAPLCADMIVEFLRDHPHEKVVVFAVHRGTIQKLVARLSNVATGVVVDGSTPSKQRAANAQKFQDDPNCRWFVGQIQAAGEAITLTASSTVYVVEGTWTPRDHDQAIARCRRFGQRRTVLADYPIIPGTIEGLIADVVARKAEGLGQLWGEH